MRIEIVKWDEFNPKELLKTPFWFRVNVNITSSQSLFGLSHTMKWVWICLLAEAMRQKTGDFPLNIDWASVHWEIKRKDLVEAIDLLSQRDLLRVDSEWTPSGLRENSSPHNKQTNKDIREKVGVAADLHILAKLWNEHSGNLPKVRKMTLAREKKCRAAWAITTDQSYWIEIAKKIASSKFHTGKNDSGWKADFDYFLREDVQTRAFEGSIGDSRAQFVEAF